MRFKSSRAALAVGATLVAATTLTVTPALASTSASAATSRPSAVTAYDAARPALAQPATSCTWNSPPGIGNYDPDLGTIICEYEPLPVVEFPNGTFETFAVGTSHAVWTAWDNGSGNWTTASLGGPGAYSAPWIVAQNGWGLTLAVSNSSGRHYCDNRGNSQSSGWTGWFTC